MDFKLAQTPEGLDLAVENGDLVMDPGLVTAVVASLWTDRRADEDDDTPDDDPRGYWADVEGDRWGSKLWLLDRSKRVEQTLRLAEDFALEGLAWMRAQGISSKITATASFGPSGSIVLAIPIARDDRPRWQELWLGTELDVDVKGPGTSLRLLFQ